MKNKFGWDRLTTPCENIKHCCISRPPLVLFTVGLCVLAVAFVSLAVYVEDTTLISNPNYDTDWSVFLTDLSEVKWSADSECVQEKELAGLPDPPKNLSEYKNSISVTVMAELMAGSFQMAPKDVYQAFVWKERILPKERLTKKTHGVKISFSLPNSETSKDNEASSLASKENNLVKQSTSDVSLLPVCMTISSEEPFLSTKLKTPLECTPGSPTAKSVTIYACSRGSEAAAPSTFNTVHDKKNLSLRIYLTEDDRMNIHIHLMSTSYFLFMMAFTVLLYGLIKRRGHTETANHLLPT